MNMYVYLLELINFAFKNVVYENSATELLYNFIFFIDTIEDFVLARIAKILNHYFNRFFYVGWGQWTALDQKD